MHATSPEAVQKQIKLYTIVGAALVVGTLVTVTAASIQFGLLAGIVVAVVIAAIKGSLVAGFFMHLFRERKLILVVLLFTGFFFISMLVLMSGAYRDQQGEARSLFGVPARHAQPPPARGHGE
jgi:cytochrome c oxidase subunit 4